MQDDDLSRLTEARWSRSSRVALALLLALIAGGVDALAYAELDNLFVSFMSGNSTRLGVDLAGLDWRAAAPVAGSIALFVAGAFAGTLLAETRAPWNVPIVLAAEAIVTGGAAMIVLATGAVTPLYVIALAMGMQNAVHPTVAGAGIGKSFVTGTLFGVGKSLADARNDPQAVWTSLANLLSWAAFVVGAVLGTILLKKIGTAQTLGAVALVLGVLAAVLVAAARGRRNLDAPQAPA